MSVLHNFKLGHEKEDLDKVSSNIENGIEFKGTNLWILIFAIFIASLGLNVNSTAVIIGAMLVSPLMGPIMGMGFGMAINDLALLRKSISSYLFAAGVGLATSSIYFLISPINEAHSEILARTSPNIYDVLIALFGGLAGMLATSSRLKGNVIPGVAIATALMPPLCTAGYGLATLQFQFFFGAFYLFLINTVFISLATLLTTRLLQFPFKHLPQKIDETKARRIVWLVVIITVLPSIYFGYDMVRQNKFIEKSNRFIENEAIFPNDYLLKKSIDAKNYVITLIYGGKLIEETEIQALRNKLPQYNLQNSTLEIKQGFAYLENIKESEQTPQLTIVLGEKEKQIQALQQQLDSLSMPNTISRQLFNEVKTQYPSIQSFALQKAINHTDTTQHSIWLAVVHSKAKWNKKEQTKLKDWLKVRLNIEQTIIYFQE